MTTGSESTGEAEVKELLKGLFKLFTNGGGERTIVKLNDPKLVDCEALIAKYDLWNREDKLTELFKLVGKLKQRIDRTNAVIIIGRGIFAHKEERLPLHQLEKFIALLEDLPTEEGDFFFVQQTLCRRFRAQLKGRLPKNGDGKQLERIIGRLDEICTVH